MSPDIFASVIIPTRNRAELLTGCLRSLRAQDYPNDRYEIIVVDDGSTDGTPDVVRAAIAEADGVPIRLVRQGPKGLNAARNNGIRNASGEILCFVDDDEDAPRQWLSAMADAAARHPGPSAFVGRILYRFEGKVPRLCGKEPIEDWGLDLGDEDTDLAHTYGGNLAIRPDAISLAGWFDEGFRLWGGDDFEWGFRFQRAGGRVLYIADALIWHRRTAEDLRLSSMMRKRFQRGRGDVRWRPMVGQSLPSTGEDVKRAVRGVAHRLRRGCSWGLLTAAESSGRLWERARS